MAAGDKAKANIHFFSADFDSIPGALPGMISTTIATNHYKLSCTETAFMASVVDGARRRGSLGELDPSLFKNVDAFIVKESGFTYLIRHFKTPPTALVIYVQDTESPKVKSPEDWTVSHIKLTDPTRDLRSIVGSIDDCLTRRSITGRPTSRRYSVSGAPDSAPGAAGTRVSPAATGGAGGAARPPLAPSPAVTAAAAAPSGRRRSSLAELATAFAGLLGLGGTPAGGAGAPAPAPTSASPAKES